MPLPKRKKGESHDDFVKRCMADPIMNREFPDAAQRRAVCERLDAKGQVNFTCEAGNVTIEAADAGDDGQQKLPRFTMIAYTGDAMSLAWWAYPVVVDLQGLKIPSQNLPVRFGHDYYHGVGHTESIRVENNQLIATGVISRDTEAAREIVASAKKGFPWQASISASVEDQEFFKADKTVNVNGREFRGPIYVIRAATLGEISFVDLGADSKTTAIVAKGQEGSIVTDDLNPQVQGAAPEPDHIPEPKPEPQVSVQGQQASYDAELARIKAIQAICDGGDAIAQQVAIEAIEAGWEPKKAALELLRRRRPQVRVVAEGADEFRKDVVAGITGDSKSRWYGVRLSALARYCCELEGVAIRNEWPHEKVIEAAFSTRSLPSILKDSAQKILIDSYQAVDRASVRVSKIIEAVDFKTHTLAQLVGQYRFEKVAPDGELPHATVSDQGYTVKVDTYGRIVGLTRQDVINDDLNAFLDIPRQLGRGAALALENAFWSMVEAANGSFFSSGNANVISGASGAFGVAGLSAAIAKLRKQKDPDGNPIKARPRFVAIPPDLEADATQIYTSNVLLIAGSSDRTIGVNNPHANKYEPVVSEYLTGNGASSPWYLIADPMDVPAFGVAFLRGQQTPVIEEAAPDPKYLGTLWRGYFDFGVALLDHRGAVRANGA